MWHEICRKWALQHRLESRSRPNSTYYVRLFPATPFVICTCTCMSCIFDALFNQPKPNIFCQIWRPFSTIFSKLELFLNIFTDKALIKNAKNSIENRHSICLMTQSCTWSSNLQQIISDYYLKYSIRGYTILV